MISSNYRMLLVLIGLILSLAINYIYDKTKVAQYKSYDLVILSEDYQVTGNTCAGVNCTIYNIGSIYRRDAGVKFNKDIIYYVGRLYCLHYDTFDIDCYVGQPVSVTKTEIKERFSFENPKHIDLVPHQKLREELIRWAGL